MATPGGFEQSVYVLATEPAGWPTAITAAAVNAGVAIHADLPAPLNFAGTTNRMDTSVIASRQDNNEPGTLTLDSLTVEAFRRKTGAVAIPALDDDTPYWLVKFEGGNIAAGDHGTPAIGDKCDAAAVSVGTKSDVDTPRGDPRRMSVPMEILDTVIRDLVLT
jgi:hypothetical protein